ncbi:hypothetical protein D3C71_1228370 [compost metagenome]
MHQLGRRVFGRGRGEHVGQVVLALRIGIGQRTQPTTQRRRFGGDDAGVDRADALLLIVGILLLDDGGHLALGIAHDAPVAARVLHLGHQHCQAR